MQKAGQSYASHLLILALCKSLGKKRLVYNGYYTEVYLSDSDLYQWLVNISTYE